MAEIPKSGRPTLSNLLPPPPFRLSGLVAGEDLAAGDACYIKAADGKVWRASGAAANAAAKVRGFAAEAAGAGQGVTLLRNVNIAYGTGLAPGTDLYLSGTVQGGLADAPSTGGLNPIAFVFDASRIHVGPGWRNAA